MPEQERDGLGLAEEIPSWYLSVSKRVYGPFTFSVLCQWSSEGRIGPGNELSQDKTSWTAVHSMRNLEMNWSASDDTGWTFGPFNLLGLPNLIQWRVIPQDATLENAGTGQVFDLTALLKPEALPPGSPPKALSEKIREILKNQG